MHSKSQLEPLLTSSDFVLRISNNVLKMAITIRRITNRYMLHPKFNVEFSSNLAFRSSQSLVNILHLYPRDERT